MGHMENNKHLGAQQFAETFLTDLSPWSGQTSEHEQHHDITLLVVDFKRS